MTADEEAQLKNYLQNINPDDGNSPYASENYVHSGYGPITFWDKREVIVSNKDVTPDGLAMPATATLTFMYALTIEDAVVFVDPKTELDEKVIAALFMIPTPAKFGKPFFKQADDLGGAASVRRKGKKDGDSLGTKGTGKDIQIPSVRNNEFNEWFDSLSVDKFEEMWSVPHLRSKIEDRIRRPGGYH